MYRIYSIFTTLLLDTAMESEVAEYDIGKRYLANIMGMDEANFSQDDINVRIRAI